MLKRISEKEALKRHMDGQQVFIVCTAISKEGKPIRIPIPLADWLEDKVFLADAEEKTISDKEVQRPTQVNYSDIRLPLWVMYKSPKDYPGKVVARLFSTDEPTNTVIVKQSVEELSEVFSEEGYAFIPRNRGDDRVIMGAWI